MVNYWIPHNFKRNARNSTNEFSYFHQCQSVGFDHRSLSNKLGDHLPHGGRFHPREIVGVTCVVSYLLEDCRRMTNVNCYVSICVLDLRSIFDVIVFVDSSLLALHWLNHRLFQCLMLCDLIVLTKLIYSIMIGEVISISLLFIILLYIDK